MLTLLAYVPALRSGFIWDDDDYVTENQTLRDIRGLKRIWFEPGATPQYYPLVHTTFWVEYQLWGLNASGYHVVNVLLHAAAAILLGHALSRLQVRGAWLAAAIFALHPIQVESVAWITERKNVLSAVFYFAAVLAWLRVGKNLGSTKQKAEIGSTPSVFSTLFSGWYWLAMFLFMCALLSKTVTCSFPAAMLLLCWWKKGRIQWRDVWPLLPFFAMGLWLGLNTVWMEKHTVGARGPDWELSIVERCLIAGRALWFYVGKLIWPANLTFIYPRWTVSAGVWWQWLFPIGALAVVAALWSMRKQLGRGPLVAVLFYAGTLFPALGFVNVYPMRYSFVADHFQYLAGIGLIVLGAAGLSRLSRGASIALPAMLGLLTWQQTQDYRDLETLWRNTLAKNPACWMAHNNLGLILADKGQHRAALAHYREALRLKPDYSEPMNNIGTILLTEGQTEEAIDYFNKAFRADPNYAEALSNIGIAFFKQGRTNEAVQKFRETLKINPASQPALINLGVALSALRQYDEAIGYLQTAVRLKPDQVEGRINLGSALTDAGRLDEAVAEFQAALALVPDNFRAKKGLARAYGLSGRYAEALTLYTQVARAAPQDAETHYSMGVILSGLGRTAEAIESYRLALKWDPRNAEAHNNLGVDLVRTGRGDEAIAHFTEALRLRPGYPEAHNNLAFVLARRGQREEAIMHLREALRLKPDYPAAKQQLRELGAALE